MTIQQLEYILAVDQFRHFARAAEYCRVTQPTLSAMIQKLEDELGVKLFDRTVQPVCPTPIGQKVIDQARVILAQAAQVKEIISEDKQSLSGVFRLGVLPTIAPYLLPRFFPQLMEKYPELDISFGKYGNLYANGRKWKRNHFYSRIGSDAIDGRTAAVGTSVCHSPTYTASGTGNK